MPLRSPILSRSPRCVILASCGIPITSPGRIIPLSITIPTYIRDSIVRLETEDLRRSRSRVVPAALVSPNMSNNVGPTNRHIIESPVSRLVVVKIAPKPHDRESSVRGRSAGRDRLVFTIECRRPLKSYHNITSADRKPRLKAEELYKKLARYQTPKPHSH